VKKDKNAAPVTCHGCGKPGAPAEGMLCRNCGGNAYAPGAGYRRASKGLLESSIP
jgi:rRNA maturation endonuclease Nob1